MKIYSRFCHCEKDVEREAIPLERKKIGGGIAFVLYDIRNVPDVGFVDKREIVTCEHHLHSAIAEIPICTTAREVGDAMGCSQHRAGIDRRSTTK
jgi:hypothetical protein